MQYFTPDELRLREIEQELDKTAPWENPPYRNERQKLNREKAGIWKRIEGMDARKFADCKRKGRPGKSKKGNFHLKQQIVRIMDEIEKARRRQLGPRWWERGR